MNKKFAGKLKSELAITIKKAMNNKGIATYKQLIEYCGLENINNHLSDILTGRQKIKETDLLKLSNKLEIPMDYFRRIMKSETRYYVEEYIPISEEINKCHKCQTEKEYQHNYYLRVTKLKRKGLYDNPDLLEKGAEE